MAGDVDVGVGDLVVRAGGTPVSALAEAVVSVVESVSPAGRLLLVPATVPPPLVSPWHPWQVPGLATAAWKRVALLQALPEGLASAAWQAAQSAAATAAAPWFIHCPALLLVPPAASR